MRFGLVPNDGMTLSCAERLVAVENARLITASHAAVDVGSVGPHCRKCGDLGMVGSKVTHRIGCAGVTGEREGLAAAAAEIELATRAARARLLHPRAAAEGIE